MKTSMQTALKAIENEIEATNDNIGYDSSMLDKQTSADGLLEVMRKLKARLEALNDLAEIKKLIEKAIKEHQ